MNDDHNCLKVYSDPEIQNLTCVTLSRQWPHPFKFSPATVINAKRPLSSNEHASQVVYQLMPA